MIRKEQVRTRWARNQARDGGRPAPSPEDDLLASEFDGRFRDAMAELPERRREVFELVRFRGLSYAEAASAMGLSHQTVANQMTLAHKDLRRLLGDLLSDSMTDRVGQPGRRSGDG
jgi:RNA polymerase sigma factor (sigma-70 family)